MLFGLPLRQTLGLVESLIQFAGLDWPDPDYLTLCRLQARIAVQVPYRTSEQSLNLLIDSTGIKFRGDSEWQARKHGPSRRRQWRKVHVAIFDQCLPLLKCATMPLSIQIKKLGA